MQMAKMLPKAFFSWWKIYPMFQFMWWKLLRKDMKKTTWSWPQLTVEENLAVIASPKRQFININFLSQLTNFLMVQQIHVTNGETEGSQGERSKTSRNWNDEYKRCMKIRVTSVCRLFSHMKSEMVSPRYSSWKFKKSSPLTNKSIHIGKQKTERFCISLHHGEFMDDGVSTPKPNSLKWFLFGDFQPFPM